MVFSAVVVGVGGDVFGFMGVFEVKIVLCHGTFDFLHYGHVVHFQEARGMGEWLVVTLTADEFVRKGPGRPIFNENERLLMVRALRCVDEAYIARWGSGLEMIRRFRPAFYCKGGDYLVEDKHGNLEMEREEVEKYGGKLVLTSHCGWSSTELIRRLRG